MSYPYPYQYVYRGNPDAAPAAGSDADPSPNSENYGRIFMGHFSFLKMQYTFSSSFDGNTNKSSARFIARANLLFAPLSPRFEPA